MKNTTSPLIAVIMSVYKGDSPNYLDESLTSLYQQTYQNFDLYLQVDGPISPELIKVIERFNEKVNFFVDYVSVNKGLATQLNIAIKKVVQLDKYEYLARMDADDISLPLRFEKQLSFFKRFENIAVCGSDVIEFGYGDYHFIKSMESDPKVIFDNMIRRCPLNHPTVMFSLNRMEKDDIKYIDNLPNTQDYYLWVELLSKGYNLSNINEPLLKFRVDRDFHSRRGLKKSIIEFKSRFFAMRKLNLWSFRNVLHTIMLLMLRLSPSFLKAFAYKNFRG